ncbi:MAG TPA: hypothetical protein VFY29_21280 [Terriglobia bacterium]|nr:hypothetical protein [Terriglobia bacterium]
MNKALRMVRTIRTARRASSRRLAFVFALFAVGVVCAFAAVPQQAAAAISVNYTALGDSVAFGAFAPIGHG